MSALLSTDKSGARGELEGGERRVTEGREEGSITHPSFHPRETW